MRSDLARVAWLVLGVTLGAAACSSPQSFIVLDLELDPAAPPPPTPITGVVDVVVTVSNTKHETKPPLTYPAPSLTIDAVPSSPDAGSPTLDAGSFKTLSVSFSSGETGSVTFDVAAVDIHNCVIGRGTATQVIRKGGVTEIPVPMRSVLECNPDGGAPEGGTEGGTEGGVVTFPGCDPVSPATGAGACASNQTCQVNCSTLRDECTMAGSGPPGTVCASTNGNVDCQPGEQCFNYSNGNAACTAASICLRFCNSDADCASFGAGGGGPGSFCQGPVECRNPTRVTAYHTCTFNCDPTAAAVATRGGCPGSLVCMMPASMDEVDCACPETTRTKTEGQACTGASDCAPGLICNSMNGAKTCRPICRCNAVGGACSVNANTCPTTGTICTAVTNNTLFGVCL